VAEVQLKSKKKGRLAILKTSIDERNVSGKRSVVIRLNANEKRDRVRKRAGREKGKQSRRKRQINIIKKRGYRWSHYPSRTKLGNRETFAFCSSSRIIDRGFSRKGKRSTGQLKIDR